MQRQRPEVQIRRALAYRAMLPKAASRPGPGGKSQARLISSVVVSVSDERELLWRLSSASRRSGRLSGNELSNWSKYSLSSRSSVSRLPARARSLSAAAELGEDVSMGKMARSSGGVPGES